MEFEWDVGKATANRSKHGVSFEEAATVFEPAAPEIFEDASHSDRELRFLAIGFSVKSRLLSVVFTRDNKVTRIISARKSTRNEVVLYGQAKREKG